MFNFKIKVNNREVPHHSFGKALTDALKAKNLEIAKKEARRRLSQLRCPEHNERPGIADMGSSLSVSGCCPKLIQGAERLLK